MNKSIVLVELLIGIQNYVKENNLWYEPPKKVTTSDVYYYIFFEKGSTEVIYNLFSVYNSISCMVRKPTKFDNSKLIRNHITNRLEFVQYAQFNHTEVQNAIEWGWKYLND